MTARAVIFDWGGTLSESVNAELVVAWRLAARSPPVGHVPMPPRLPDELSAYLGPRRADREKLVFTSPQGGQLRHGNF